MSEQSYVEFHELDLNSSNLEALSDDQFAVLSVLCFAVSEVNTFRKCYVSSLFPETGSLTIQSALRQHQFTIMRTWSAKLYECSVFIKKLAKNQSGLKDSDVKSWADESWKAFTSNHTGEGYEVAKWLRNEVSNHYSIKAARDNRKHIPAKFDLKFYTHENGGNDFFPLGEGVLFHARLNRRWANLNTEQEKTKMFGEWLEWNISTTDWLLAEHAKFADQFVFKKLADLSWKPTSYEVPKQMIDRDLTSKAPIFLERSR